MSIPLNLTGQVRCYSEVKELVVLFLLRPRGHGSVTLLARASGNTHEAREETAAGNMYGTHACNILESIEQRAT